ncbi:helix-turn-helix domain-containing protein [Candidatus Thiodubiliella endoseptemdiera]|uniref:Helix-turn-helix transcriptional regulator n=1 Tax=Candidatus Thiodubiliella endoseptemdiera TaxID=2738886 RepID=A0A853EZ36_9GAMM|nr:helix-turn-helix transcriptional regulator [Candidatus Thiodubiliella endoseptemdiera]
MNYQEFGKFIKQLRQGQKISQQTMANHLCISRATLSGFENGVSGEIGFKKVLQIVDYLGYELNLKEMSAFPVFEEVIDG